MLARSREWQWHSDVHQPKAASQRPILAFLGSTGGGRKPETSIAFGVCHLGFLHQASTPKLASSSSRSSERAVATTLLTTDATCAREDKLKSLASHACAWASSSKSGPRIDAMCKPFCEVNVSQLQLPAAVAR